MISTHHKPEKPDKPVVDLTVEKQSGDRSDDGIVIVDEGYGLDDVIDDDVDLIDLSDSHIEDDWLKTGDANDADDDDDYASKDLTDEALNRSFINTSLFNICIDDDDNNADNDDDDDKEHKDQVGNQPDRNPAASPVNKWLLCMDTLESNKDLAWDNLTFKLMNTMPLMMVSTSAVDNILENSQNNSDTKSSSSFEPISSSDTSSYDHLNDLSDDDMPLIPEWFFNPDYQPLTWDNFSDDFSFELVDDDNSEPAVPEWLYDQCNSNPEDSEDFEPMIPNWLYDPYHDTCKDIEDSSEPLIPDWFYNPNHSTHNDTWNETDFSDSDWDSDYTDESDDDDDSSSVVIPDWLFGERKNKQQQDDDSFLFSQLFVDVPTFIILLFLTTALGFSIGHGECDFYL